MISIFLRSGRALATALVFVLVSVPVTAEAARSKRRAPEPQTVMFGAATEGNAYNMSPLDQFEKEAGKRVSLYCFYRNFRSNADFDADAAANIHKRGAIPMLTWEPWDPHKGRRAQPSFTPARIAAGDYDDYIRRWARQIADWDRPLWLRFAHEMNGNWYPWGKGVGGNSPSEYRAAWRRVHHIFQKAGAHKVTWVWSPNIIERDEVFPLDGLYPGDDVVDVMGVDGYNWGDHGHHHWTSPDEVFTPTLKRLRAISGKPIVIAETGSAEKGGDKASWIRHFFELLSRNTDVIGFVWFNLHAERDWRITTSQQARRAFASSVSGQRYG